MRVSQPRSAPGRVRPLWRVNTGVQAEPTAAAGTVVGESGEVSADAAALVKGDDKTNNEDG